MVIREQSLSPPPSKKRPFHFRRFLSSLLQFRFPHPMFCIIDFPLRPTYSLRPMFVFHPSHSVTLSKELIQNVVARLCELIPLARCERFAISRNRVQTFFERLSILSLPLPHSMPQTEQSLDHVRPPPHSTALMFPTTGDLRRWRHLGKQEIPNREILVHF